MSMSTNMSMSMSYVPRVARQLDNFSSQGKTVVVVVVAYRE